MLGSRFPLEWARKQDRPPYAAPERKPGTLGLRANIHGRIPGTSSTAYSTNLGRKRCRICRGLTLRVRFTGLRLLTDRTYGSSAPKVYTGEGVKFYAKSFGQPHRLGVLAGSFNPPTAAHLQLVDAAFGYYVDEVLCVVPRAFPHKEYFGATLDQRLELLQRASDDHLPYSIATSEAGLFLDIAAECRAHYGPVELSFICGRDAAERVLSWDYGRTGAVEEMLREFELLVAARQGEFEPPAEHRHRIRKLHLRGRYDDVSSTEVRNRIARSEPWEHLVPRAIVERIRAIYS